MGLNEQHKQNNNNNKAHIYYLCQRQQWFQLWTHRSELLGVKVTSPLPSKLSEGASPPKVVGHCHSNGCVCAMSCDQLRGVGLNCPPVFYSSWHLCMNIMKLHRKFHILIPMRCMNTHSKILNKVFPDHCKCRARHRVTRKLLSCYLVSYARRQSGCILQIAEGWNCRISSMILE